MVLTVLACQCAILAKHVPATLLGSPDYYGDVYGYMTLLPFRKAKKRGERIKKKQKNI